MMRNEKSDVNDEQSVANDKHLGTFGNLPLVIQIIKGGGLGSSSPALMM